MSGGQQHKWGRPKQAAVGPTATLSLEQQQILAAVPRYKKAWVRPASLKPGQNPNFKILKWVIDTDQDKSAGTEEEMREALEQVTAGNVPLPSEQAQPAAVPAVPSTVADTSSASASAVPSASATGPAPTPSIGTPAAGTPAPPDSASAQPAIPSTELARAPNPIAQAQGNDPAKPAEGPASSGEAAGVQEAVKGLGEVEMDAAVNTGPSVPDEAKSLVQEDQVAPQA